MTSESRANWKRRITDVLRSEDTQKIVRHRDAGRIIDGLLTMHNGIKIEPLSYYGYPTCRMLRESRGVHEPQEERVFAEVLKVMPKSATMVELGSYWSFYSMWFHQEVDNAWCYMVEPTDEGLAFGRKNFAINGMEGNFHQAYVGNETGVTNSGETVTTVDAFTEQLKLNFIDILHSDIQGAESDMLDGARRVFQQRKIGYCFISTHSEALHQECVDKLEEFGQKLLHSIPPDKSFSVDGLIVSRDLDYPAIQSISLSEKT